MELRGDRYHFVSRRDGIIVGGLRVHPEEIEAVANRHPAVPMSRARLRRSPITDSILVADVILAANGRHCEKEIATKSSATAGRPLLPTKYPR